MVPTDLLRLLVAITALAFAAITDLRWRRAPDATWWVVGILGVALLGIDLLQGVELTGRHLPALAVSGLVLAMAVLGYYTGLIGGGADAKAIMSLAILAPMPLGAGWTLPLASPFPLVLTALINGLLVAMLVPLVLGVRNLLRGDLAGAHTFLATRVPVEKMDLRVVWPVEHLDEDGDRTIAWSPRHVPDEAFDPAWLEAHGFEEVWVTPKVPFLVPLWVGVVLAALLGDPALAVIDALAA